METKGLLSEHLEVHQVAVIGSIDEQMSKFLVAECSA